MRIDQTIALNALTDILNLCRDVIEGETVICEDELEEIFTDQTAEQLRAVIRMLEGMEDVGTFKQLNVQE